MSPDLLKQFYQEQDVLIVPSRFDVSPTVVLEALTQGIPVIISKNTGWVDVFKQFGLGSMIIDPTASGARIAQVIGKLQNQHPEYRSRYSKLRTHLLSQHNPRRVFAQYLALFKSSKS
jgi:glycosyltransferase involved in cell wall biosynthesis